MATAIDEIELKYEAPPGAVLPFTFGLLHERDSAEALWRQEQARRAWRRASQRKYRQWIRR